MKPSLHWLPVYRMALRYHLNPKNIEIDASDHKKIMELLPDYINIIVSKCNAVLLTVFFYIAFDHSKKNFIIFYQLVEVFCRTTCAGEQLLLSHQLHLHSRTSHSIQQSSFNVFYATCILCSRFLLAGKLYMLDLFIIKPHISLMSDL